MTPYQKELIKAYNNISTYSTSSWKIENFNAAQLVHDYRMFWKPEKVNVLLLAESHVLTDLTDFARPFHSNSKISECPYSYVRFVYCLGYGESGLFKNNPPNNNKGTPQFWNLFSKTSQGKYRVLKKDEPILHKRIENKISLLEEMKNKGIWLLDASIVALYENGRKPENADYKEVLKRSFKDYCLPIINFENPSLIVIIGKGVNKVIGSSIPTSIPVEVIDQPQAREQKHTIDQIVKKYPSLF
jgi:hypothetical protein